MEAFQYPAHTGECWPRARLQDKQGLHVAHRFSLLVAYMSGLSLMQSKASDVTEAVYSYYSSLGRRQRQGTKTREPELLMCISLRILPRRVVVLTAHSSSVARPRLEPDTKAVSTAMTTTPTRSIFMPRRGTVTNMLDWVKP